MRFGTAIFPTDDTPPPGELGRIVEERGFDSLFVTEHTPVPADHAPHPDDDELPRRYTRILDPFVTLAAVAEATTTLRLGFGVSLFVQRDPITPAKEVASLDCISGGRVDFGVGAGWNRPEVENHGTPFDRRFVAERFRA
jgi:alkanesulfonate monooxygenase SsuD/methylene tetrahydromethanopterin reductase-like flavin-dependent oxidoreductase (luciferase family)